MRELKCDRTTTNKLQELPDPKLTEDDLTSLKRWNDVAGAIRDANADFLSEP